MLWSFTFRKTPPKTTNHPPPGTSLDAHGFRTARHNTDRRLRSQLCGGHSSFVYAFLKDDEKGPKVKIQGVLVHRGSSALSFVSDLNRDGV
ncbi:Hypothetical protein NTJ_06344 [Nesidiocoris tenuis]|uniref:Uncharacterized protein n=1 Tax=Nesidiocoris tenuis TaxID=355587 RepID=A0ABN7AMS4_9HEMI|nr:Hypothetical protein NTJ_06344 [Nesidiocoris tenuis]